MKKFDSNSGMREFDLTGFKKQLSSFIKGKNKLKVNFQESASDDNICFISKISKFSIKDDTDDYILDATFRNKREVNIILPKDRVNINEIYIDGKQFIYEARTDEGKALLGIGFEVL